MDKKELEALADAMLAEHRGAPPVKAAVPPPSAPPPVAPAPDDLEAWADALLAQHRTAPSSKQKLPPVARLVGKLTGGR